MRSSRKFKKSRFHLPDFNLCPVFYNYQIQDQIADTDTSHLTARPDAERARVFFMKKQNWKSYAAIVLAAAMLTTGCGAQSSVVTGSSSVSAVAESGTDTEAADTSSAADSETTADAQGTGQMPPDGQPGGQPGGAPGGQSSGVDSYTAVNDYTSDTTVTGKTLSSTGTDENAVLVDSGASVTLDNDTISRTSSDSTGGDNSSFYGVGSAVLVKDGTGYVKDTTITTDAAGAAGVFAYDSGTAYVADTKITTTQNTSGGIHVAGGGKLYAWDLDVETSGESAAAIRSDRGGGTMVVDGGSYTSNGVGSPAVYCTADISVNDADLTANGSEGICLEGLNSLKLYDSDLTSNMSDIDGNGLTWSVILYQSMSGDSEVGEGSFEMDGGSLTSKNGGLFYTTNTESSFVLDDVDITSADDDFFLQCTGNSNSRGWGTAGANGATCNFTGIDQTMEGNVIWDSISKLDFYMTQGSTLTGAVVDDETNAGNGGDGYCNLYISDDSKWVVTGDSTVTSLYNAGTIVDNTGKTVTIKGTDGTVYVKGTGSYTVTVGSYSTKADLSGAGTTTSFSDVAVSKPSQLS